MPEHNSRVGVTGIERVSRTFDRLVERRVIEERRGEVLAKDVAILERQIAEQERKARLARRLMPRA